MTVFEYNKQFHNVVRVTHKNYRCCNATGSFGTMSSGNDTFMIVYPGHYYFICSFPGHCEDGQKVDIRVLPPSSSSPSPSPAPAATVSPSPSKSKSNGYKEFPKGNLASFILMFVSLGIGISH